MPKLVALINNHTKKTYQPKTGLEQTDILYKNEGLELIPLGTKVRVALYYAKDFDGNRLTGNLKPSIITDDVTPPRYPVFLPFLFLRGDIKTSKPYSFFAQKLVTPKKNFPKKTSPKKSAFGRGRVGGGRYDEHFPCFPRGSS
jgi:hypothetical protein